MEYFFNEEAKAMTCPTCQTSFRKFRQTGQLGCPDCYKVFKKALEKPIQRIQFRLKHNGKVPAFVAPSLRFQSQLNQLREEMAQAVAQENFEDAAKLRDKIRELEESCHE